MTVKLGITPVNIASLGSVHLNVVAVLDPIIIEPVEAP